MPIGPGKYDDLCTYVLETAKAEGAVVIVIRGERGSGFSVQMLDRTEALLLADVLENVARQIRDSLITDPL
jgi:hypothetical protein